MAPQDLATQAIEDYDLALSRLAWAEDCHCQFVGEQLDAMAWHTSQCEETLTTMQALLTDAIPEQPRR